ncbi:hypothetical protein E2C01_078000 [Portunus trituberculatus]|uniref:Uncharacterized protein n=1 Tax=Portunus trituberculatus TaxID=210409 RepID=A0A5B7ILJ0_PORTR|nr:hypothetical protein [Portunus trituberculatus]
MRPQHLQGRELGFYPAGASLRPRGISMPVEIAIEIIGSEGPLSPSVAYQKESLPWL